MKTAKQNQPATLTKKAMYDDSILIEGKRGSRGIDETIEEGEEEESELAMKSITEL